MRVAIISDVHANYHALEAVLSDIDRDGVDAVWCLGDTVGYGPRPNECCDEVRHRSDQCLVGNHDLVVLGELDVGDFNDEAAAAVRWTSDVLAAESRDFLQQLEPSARLHGVDLFHASARDPVWEYVLTEEAARGTLELSTAPIVLVGHSHVALAIARIPVRRRDDQTGGDHGRQRAVAGRHRAGDCREMDLAKHSERSVHAW